MQDRIKSEIKKIMCKILNASQTNVTTISQCLVMLYDQNLYSTLESWGNHATPVRSSIRCQTVVPRYISAEVSRLLRHRAIITGWRCFNLQVPNRDSFEDNWSSTDAFRLPAHHTFIQTFRKFTSTNVGARNVVTGWLFSVKGRRTINGWTVCRFWTQLAICDAIFVDSTISSTKAVLRRSNQATSKCCRLQCYIL